eukprot:1243107-Amphidinium_carterae.1
MALIIQATSEPKKLTLAWKQNKTGDHAYAGCFSKPTDPNTILAMRAACPYLHIAMGLTRETMVLLVEDVWRALCSVTSKLNCAAAWAAIARVARTRQIGSATCPTA